MIKFYIVKQANTDDNVLRPNFKISLNEYQDAIDSNADFTWCEDTEHGLEILKKHSFTLKHRAYYNYVYKDPSGYIQLLWGQGSIHLFVEGETIKNADLIGLIEFSDSLDSCLWKFEPTGKIDHLGEEIWKFELMEK